MVSRPWAWEEEFVLARVKREAYPEKGPKELSVERNEYSQAEEVSHMAKAKETGSSWPVVG